MQTTPQILRKNNNAAKSSTKDEPKSSVQDSTNTLPQSPIYGPSVEEGPKAKDFLWLCFD